MAEMKISLDEIYKLMDKLSQSGLKEVSIQDGNYSLTIKAKEDKIVSVATPVVSPEAVTVAQPAKAMESKTAAISGNMVKSPIVGTFYAAPSPDKAPFVSVGDKVKKGDILFVIESMKLMNEIPSDFDGTVKEILVNNAQAVEYDQPIMVIE